MIKPLGDKIVVEPIESKNETKRGIILAHAKKESSDQGIVVSVGIGRIGDNGKPITPEVKVGDHIIFSKFAGTPIKDGDKEYLIIFERDIIAVIE